MPTVSVLLISSETLPNVLFIKEFPAEQYVFITTRKMEEEGRSHWIISSAGIEKIRVKCIVEVNQDNFENILQSLENAQLQPTADWVVNITCGNKLMSIAAFNFFARYHSRIFYLAVGNQHFEQLFPYNNLHPIKYKLNLKEYFNAYGRNYESQPQINIPDALGEASKIMESCRGAKGIIRESSYLNQKLNEYTKGKLRQFFSGSWFEFYVYETIQKYLNLPASNISLSTAIYLMDSKKVHTSDTKDNDIDVCFVYKNYLYLMECKVYTGQKNVSLQDSVVTTGVGNIQSHLYKLAAVKQPLGLSVRAYLITPNNLRANSASFEAIEKRCKILQINQPIDYQILQSEDSFKKFLDKL
ncbi:MAG: DUF1887 family CARF protein [Cytophagales bacterium]|nr:DUF1887 family CARF protein [Bernardetiaceae bacterium]MDW8211052.1 DUF1887 family CARF protein [Cytophagales bacterium]